MSDDKQVGELLGRGRPPHGLGVPVTSPALPKVQGAVQGGSRHAREAWKQDLERA